MASSLATQLWALGRTCVMAFSALILAFALGPASASATALPSTISKDMTLTAAGNPYTGSSTIASGVTVNVEPGVKFLLNNTLNVKGTLKVEGTAEKPVLFTGSKEKSPGEWCHVRFASGSGASVIDHAELKYGGACSGGTIYIDEGSSPTITNSTIAHSSSRGIRVGLGGSPEIANNAVINNATTGIYYLAGSTSTGEVNIHNNFVEGGTYGIYVSIDSAASVVGKTLGANTIVKTSNTALYYSGPDIPGNITGNTLIENSSNVITIHEGDVATSSTWNDGGSPVKVSGTITVESGVTLKITKGVRLIGTPSMSVKGTLDVDGTAEKPVVFTGAKEEEPGEWNSIRFQAGSGASVIDHAEIKYGGSGGSGAIHIEDGSSPTIINSTISHSSSRGIKVFPGASPEIANNAVINNATTGIYYLAGSTSTGEVNIHNNFVEGGTYGIYVSIDSAASVVGKTLGANTIVKTSNTALYYSGPDIPGNITGNTLIENSSNVITIHEGDVATSSTWNDGGSPVKVSGTITVESGVTLKITKGVRLIGTPNMTVKGTLDVDGTAEEPVVFTGSKEEAPGEWNSIRFLSGSSASVIDHAEIKYGGSGSGAIVIEGTSPTITNSTIRKSASAGIRVEESGAPKIEWNRFRTNASGVSYVGSGNLLTPNNDWGCASGPEPAGCGDSVTSNVKWKPAVQLPELNAQCRGKESQCGEGADPVILATGQLSYSHRDLHLTNKGEIPLEFTRSYASGSSSDTGLGPGWSQSGLASATELDSGAVLVLRQDGRQDLFYKTGEGVYKAPSGVTSMLAKVEGTFQLTTLENSVYRFDESGRIASITDDHGLKTSYGYNASGRLATITDPSEQTLTFAYNVSNHITKITDSTGREVKYTYSGAGDLATVTDALGGVTEYTYDSEHRLKTIKDPRGNVILKNTYDGQGRVIEQLDGLENLWTLDYKEDETIVTEPEGGEIAYGFDGQKRLVSETNQLGQTTTTSYDEAGNIDEIVKPGGAKWQFGHDGDGNLTSVIDPEEGERSYEYNGQNRLTSFTDEREETWTYEWDEDNDLERIVDPVEGETTFTHDAAGQPLTATDPNENTTTFTYDGRGNRLTSEDALEHTTSFGYNSRSHLISKTEPGLEPEEFGRNALGDLISKTTPEGHKTEYAYDANGMLRQITDPAEGIWEIERNAMERPTAFVDPLEERREIAYDGNLNRVKVTDRRGKETIYDYDLANQLTEVVRTEGGDWEFDYDARGNQIEAVDPRENATTYEYDLLDRMTEVAEPLEAVTKYIYDPAGNLTFYTDPRENTTGLAYDELGRLTEVYQPLEKTTSFTYDEVGNRLTRTSAAGMVEFEYDAANRLEGVAEGETTLRSFGYDAANRMTSAVDAQSDEIEIGYDDDGQIVSIDDGRGQAVSREYDSRGNLVEQTDGRGTLEYDYNSLNRMTTLIDPQSKTLDFVYDAEGNLTKVELPNGVVTTNEYDDTGRLAKTVSERAETVLESLEYEYDPFGNRTSQVDRLSQETTYGYDALNRLTEFNPPGEGSTAYGYDVAGNRTKLGATTYSFNALNQLTGASDGTTYDYDDAGRLIEVDDGEQATTYGWSILDELTSADTGSQELEYTYDALGRQATRDDGLAVRPTHYGDLTDRPTVDTDAEGGVTTSYVRGPGGMVEQRSGGATTFALPDAHGDITALVDGEGGVASRQSYDPWGVQLSGPELEMGYLGAQQRRSDPATGLVRMGVRPYGPTLGSFVSEDPILGHLGIGVTLNRYAYVANNPLFYFDLTGRSFVDDAGGTIGDTWDETGGAAWDDTSGIRDDLGVAGDGNGGLLSEAPGFVSDRAQAFWKATDDYLLSCLGNGAMGAGVGAVVGFGAAGAGAVPGAIVGGASGCAQGLVQQGLDDLGQDELSDAVDYGSGARDVGRLLRDFDKEAPWVWEGLRDLGGSF